MKCPAHLSAGAPASELAALFEARVPVCANDTIVKTRAVHVAHCLFSLRPARVSKGSKIVNVNVQYIYKHIYCMYAVNVFYE